MQIKEAIKEKLHSWITIETNIWEGEGEENNKCLKYDYRLIFMAVAEGDGGGKEEKKKKKIRN